MSDSNLSRALWLIDGETVNGKLHDDHNRMAALVAGDKSPRAITTELYLVALAREPDASELAVVVPTSASPRTAARPSRTCAEP